MGSLKRGNRLIYCGDTLLLTDSLYSVQSLQSTTLLGLTHFKSKGARFFKMQLFLCGNPRTAMIHCDAAGHAMCLLAHFGN